MQRFDILSQGRTVYSMTKKKASSCYEIYTHWYLPLSVMMKYHTETITFGLLDTCRYEWPQV